VTLDAGARAIVEALQLQPHPEGGYYRETFRAPLALHGLPHGGPRAASTAIYFLLPAGGLSALHRVRSDEAWHHYQGSPVELHLIQDGGAHEVHVLGSELRAGQRPQLVVPAGVWQAAVALGPRFSLCGCTVAPGFDFADFELPPRAELLQRFPRQAALITKLTRE
jgi:predicted cupin superfamily sugar epimerase